MCPIHYSIMEYDRLGGVLLPWIALPAGMDHDRPRERRDDRRGDG